MGIVRLSELEPWIGVQKPAETPAPNALDTAWAKASAVAATVDTAAAAFGGLDKAANDLTDGEAHPSEWTRRFDEAVGKLPVDGLPDEDFADFQALTQLRSNRLKVAAVRRQHEDIATRFEDALDGYVQRAADAPSNAIEATFRNQAFRAIERIDQAGLLGPGVADRLRAELPARIDRALALRAIERDPAHAAALLTQPGALPALDDSERARLARKAGERAERQGHEKALADERHRAGTVAELWSQLGTLDDADIDSAEAAGRLRASEAQDFRQRLQVDRDARRQRTDAIARVNDVLAGEGALDPSSPEDRKAVDAHFAETERGWDDNQVAAELRPGQIGAYVGRTGILPPAIKDRIGAAFRAGDANRQNEAADIVAAIGTSAGPGALKDMALDDLLQSALIRSLRKSGLDPTAAAARASAIVSGDAQARDHNFQRDLAAAGDWVEGSGCFDIEQIVTLRERLSELVVPGTGRQPAVDALGFRTMEFRRGRDEPEVTDLLHRPGDVTRPVPLAAAGDGGQDATPGEGASDRPDEAETAQADQPGIPTEADMWPGYEPIYAKQVKERAQSLVHGGRELGMPVAAGLLQHYLDGSGGPVDLDPEWLRRQEPVTAAQKENEQRFQRWVLGSPEEKIHANPALRLLSDGTVEFKIEDGDSVSIRSDRSKEGLFWDKKLESKRTDHTDLRYAIGNGNIRSDGDFAFRREGNRILVDGVVEHRLDRERYDFDVNSLSLVPPNQYSGLAVIGGREMVLLERYEGAQSFDVRSSWQSRVSGSFRVENGRVTGADIEWHDIPSRR